VEGHLFKMDGLKLIFYLARSIMMRFCFHFNFRRCLLLCTYSMGSFLALAEPTQTVNPARVEELVKIIPPHATGMGPSITNRIAWEKVLKSHPEMGDALRSAEKLLSQPMPEQPDSLFLEFAKNGNRTDWQGVASKRRDRIQYFTIAECIENKGRFVQALEDTITALCQEPTWVLPAHDKRLENFHGETIEIDLGSSMLALEMATAYHLMGDRLSPAVRQLIRDNLERRIFTPYRDAIHGKRKEFFWIRGRSNWNAVCLNGVTGASLAVIDSAEERAWFIAVAEKNILPYLDGGFTPDGYCVEGLGYWNYGFGRFTLFSENLRQTTRGKVDLLALPAAEEAALFGVRSEILNDVYLTIADCHPGDKPIPMMMNYLAHRMGFADVSSSKALMSGGLYDQMVMGFLPDALPGISLEIAVDELPWRTWFPISGVLECRPGTGAPTAFAVAIKGGNNGVNHGHNDVGSFSVVVGTNMVVCDPGGEVYTARTFSTNRYESKLLNSFGHSVPRVGGQLQKTGVEASAVVLGRNFSKKQDTLKLDIRSAYDLPALRKLVRIYDYQRGSRPALVVRDQWDAASPVSFESALVTWGEAKVLSPDSLKIRDGTRSVILKVDTGGRGFHWTQEKILEDSSNKRIPLRVGIVLDAQFSSGILTLTITPSKAD